jgi:hypothetical protein
MRKVTAFIILTMMVTTIEAKPREALPGSYAILPPAIQAPAPGCSRYHYVIFRIWSVMPWRF